LEAVVIARHGGPEVLELRELPDPSPGPGEALVRVRACALNHLDLWTRRGLPGLKLRFPHIPGSDIAGEVEALCGPVAGLAVGQRVMLSPGTSCGRCRACLSGQDSSCREYRILGHHLPGGYAGRVVCPVANLIPLPDSIHIEDAAAFPLVFLTAWHMLVTRAGLCRDEHVLIWAAGSGVGMAAVQIARQLGAQVIATAGNEAKLEKARELGAQHVLNHHAQDVVAEVRRITDKRGADVVCEHVGAATWERSIQALAHRGRLVTCGATTGPEGFTSLRHLFAKQLSLLGSYMGYKAELLAVAEHFFAGRLRTVVDRVLPLSEARHAHEILEGSLHFGKIVLRHES
jgi:NADPH:quinone reductase-like Zn-dependent oxidoreductase